MELTELYKLRRSFTIIGLTGRTGSGCSKVAEILTSSFEEIKKGIRESHEIPNPISSKKHEICVNYLLHGNNWQPFETIQYKNLLLFYLLSYYGRSYKNLRKILLAYYREDKNENNLLIVNDLSKKMNDVLNEYQEIDEIFTYKGKFNNIKKGGQLKKLHNQFFGSTFQIISKRIFSLLEEYGYFRRSYLLHHISCNIRKSGNPLNEEKANSIEFIYTMAELTNRLIKSKKFYNDNLPEKKPTKIVIDSLRNSLEIMFFKERYAGFYMLATKDSNNRSQQRLKDRLKKKNVHNDEIISIMEKVIDLDSTEYKTNDYSEGIFSSPDVYNCIQKSDYHILNKRKSDIGNIKLEEPFVTREEQIVKFVALIQQPGMITPSASERCMQMAYNSKLNSGCISRQVGAVVSDSNYSIKAIGWNDVPSGQTPCNLRSANDYLKGNKPDKTHYSRFERGLDLDKVDIDFKYKNKPPFTFPKAMEAYFNGTDTSDKNSHLNGKNCSFCFKTIHNHFEGEKNQVHTKSLHAEENAMLQISKYGGQGLNNGILFTTASPCELCSKKATQLGIKKIYFIDPYPGISEPQILSYNRNWQLKMKLIPFNGAIGKAYIKLYEPFMAYKDEVKIMLQNKPEDFSQINWKKSFSKIKNETLKKILLESLSDQDELDEAKLMDLLK